MLSYGKTPLKRKNEIKGPSVRENITSHQAVGNRRGLKTVVGGENVALYKYKSTS